MVAPSDAKKIIFLYIFVKLRSNPTPYPEWLGVTLKSKSPPTTVSEIRDFSQMGKMDKLLFCTGCPKKKYQLGFFNDFPWFLLVE